MIREIFEETGLTIANPKLVGVKHFYTRGDGIRYLVFLYRTNDFTGDLQSSDEGQVVWVSREDIKRGRIELAVTMDEILELYFSGESDELYYERDDEDELRRIFF